MQDSRLIQCLFIIAKISLLKINTLMFRVGEISSLVF